MTDRLVTARELGDLVGLSPATILDHWQAGTLPGHKIGRAVRFDAQEVLALTRREAKTPKTTNALVLEGREGGGVPSKTS